MVNSNKNGRTLIYSCVDKEYSHWIPLYCLGMLYHNSNIDMEIGMEGTLDDDEQQAVEYLRNRFPESKIIINENLFVRDGNYAVVDGIKCIFNTVRFITTPTITDEYIYIGDIDIICLEEDIFRRHIEFMEKENMCYSNIVRKNTDILRMSGLHFTIYDCYYPLPSFEGINMMGNDEAILAEFLIRKGIDLNYSATWRPAHGVHFSKNRPTVGGDGKIPGWGAKPYKNKWMEFIKSEEYLYIIDKSNKYIKDMTNKLNEYYENEV